jgi:hypothetical protein
MARLLAPLLCGILLATATGCDGPAADRMATAAGDRGATGLPAAMRPAPPREITFDDIKFEMEKGSPFTRDLLPERVTALAGTPIRIRGYILPSFQQTGLTQFVLVRDNQECCFGPGAALYDCIVVRMRPGKTADFSIRPVAVAGEFKLEELRAPDGSHLAIYALDGDEVK